MHQKNKNINRFKEKRLLYMGAFDAPDFDRGLEAEQANKKTKEGVGLGQKNLNSELRIRDEKVEHHLDEIVDSLPKDQQPFAKKFFRPIQKDFKDKLGVLDQEYKQALDQIGRIDFRDSPEYESIIDQADALVEKVTEETINSEEAIKRVQQEMLSDLPSGDASEEEKELILSIIKNSDQGENYGDRGVSEYTEEVLEQLAMRYDIHVEDGKVVYVIDLVEGEIIKGWGEGSFDEHLLKQLKQGEYSKDNLKKRKRETRRATRKIKWIRKEIKEGSALVLGGKIDEWEAFKDHRGLEKLKDMYDQGQVETFYEEFATREAQIKGLDNYERVITEAGLNDKFKEAEAKGFKLNESKGKDIDIQEMDFNVTRVLEHPSKNLRITVGVKSKTKKVELKLESFDGEFEYQQTFNNLGDFRSLDLADMAESYEKNHKKNREKVDKSREILGSAMNGVEGVNVEDWSYSDKELAQDTFEMKPDLLKIGQHTVAEVRFMDDGKVEVDLRNKEKQVVKAEKLGETLKKNRKEMEKVSKYGNEVMVQTLTQSNLDLSALKKSERYNIERKSPQGDFTNLAGQIEVGELKTPEGKSLGRIYMAVNGQTFKRPYRLETRLVKQNFDTAADMQAYVEKNFNSLNPKEKGKIKLTGSPEEIALKKRVKEKLVNYFRQESTKAYIDSRIKALGISDGAEISEKEIDKMSTLIPETLPKSVLERIDKSDNLDNVEMTDEELQIFGENALELMGFDVDESNEEEMRIMREELTVKVKGEEKKFGEVFGGEVIGDKLFELLSRNETLEMRDGIPSIRENREWKPISGEELIARLPHSIQDQCLQILNGEEIDQTKFLGNIEFEIEMSKMNLKTKEMALKELEKIGTVGEAVESLTLFEAIRLIAQWIAEGDFEAAYDAIKANNREGVDIGVASAQAEYKQGVEKANLEELLDYRKNPRGTNAKNTFGETPFRGALKNATGDRVRTLWNMDKDSFKWEGNGLITITPNSNEEYEVSLVANPGGKDIAYLRQTRPTRQEKPTPIDISDGMTGPGNTLENLQFRAIIPVQPEANIA